MAALRQRIGGDKWAKSYGCCDGKRPVRFLNLSELGPQCTACEVEELRRELAILERAVYGAYKAARNGDDGKAFDFLVEAILAIPAASPKPGSA